MSADQDQVFHDENDQRQRADYKNAQDEIIAEFRKADREALQRVRSGCTTYADYVYLAGRLNFGGELL